MDFQYQPNDISAGMIHKSKQEETPNVFAEMDGAARVSPSAGLDRTSQQRMAGPVGARALELANNPDEQKRTQAWMDAFGMSNPGFEFNQAKAMLSAPPEQQQQQQKEEPQQ